MQGFGDVGLRLGAAAKRSAVFSAATSAGADRSETGPTAVPPAGRQAPIAPGLHTPARQTDTATGAAHPGDPSRATTYPTSRTPGF